MSYPYVLISSTTYSVNGAIISISFFLTFSKATVSHPLVYLTVGHFYSFFVSNFLFIITVSVTE